MRSAFSIVDVFASERFEGNPLAVIHDASALSAARMQAIAREFGFSETTFVLPPSDPSATARVRIFTPLEEIPFAGHPNVGTAYVVAHESTAARPFDGDAMLFEEQGGPVRVDLARDHGAVVGAEIAAPQRLRVLGAVDPARVARCLGLAPDAVLERPFSPCVASIGLPFAFAPLRDRDALEAIAPDRAAFAAAAAIGPATVDGFAICAFVTDDADAGGRASIRSRVLSPLGSPEEDPATGSAAGALCARLCAAGAAARDYRIVQGVEMGRPSVIDVRVADDGAVAIAGRCVMTARGELLS